MFNGLAYGIPIPTCFFLISLFLIWLETILSIDFRYRSVTQYRPGIKTECALYSFHSGFSYAMDS